MLGLVRECVFAQFFGTGPLLSAFRIAFMIPNLARRLFGEGALSAAFIPVFSRVFQNGSRDQAGRLAGGVLTLLMAVLIGIVAVVELGLLAAYAYRPGVTLLLSAMLLPFMGLICVTAFLGSLLNVLGRFAAPAAAPMVLNVFLIVALLSGAWLMGLSRTPLIYLACGAVLLAGVAQVGLQVWSLRAARFRLLLNRNWSQPDVGEVRRFMGPMILGLSAVQLNTLLDMLVAQVFVADGQGPAVLGYAQFLYQLPLGVFGIALATAVFPLMASRAADRDLPGMTDIVVRGMRMSLFIAVPATVGLILIAKPLVVALFERGTFDDAGTARVSRALVFYTIGLCAYFLQHILVRAFYSLKEHWTPARVAASVVALNVVLSLILVQSMGEAGVALATAISATVQVVWLTVLANSRLLGVDRRALLYSVFKTVVSAVVMGVCVWLVVKDGSPLGFSQWSAVAKVAVAVPLGCVVVGVVGRLVGSQELTELLRLRR